MKNQEGLPAGPPWPGVVQTVAWGLRPLPFFTACRRRYGPTFTMRFYDGRPIVVLSRPDDVKAVFALGAEEIEVGAGNADILEPFLGPRSLLLLDGADHRAERRRLQHAFHAERLDAYRALVAEATRRDLATWPVARPFALYPHMRAITLDVILQAVFGAGPDDLGPLRHALAAFLDGASGSVFVLIPPFRRELGGHSPWARFVRQRDAVHREVLALIGERRRGEGAGPGEGADMLSALLVDGEVPDEQVLDELMTLVLAGHDTTTTALSWAFDLLAHHPGALDRLRADLAAGSDAWLDAVVHETLRVRPVIAEVGRRLRRPLAVTGGELPAGTMVVASIHLAHTDPDRYPDPLAFRPERFLDRPPDLATWLPFGGGVRRCLGAGFATLEVREVIRTVVAHTPAGLRPARLRPEAPKRRAVTLMPRHGCRVVLDHPPEGVRGPFPSPGERELSTKAGKDRQKVPG